MDWTYLLTGSKRVINTLKSVNPYLLIIFILFGIIVLQRMFPKKVTVTEYQDRIIHDTTLVTHYDTVVKNKIKTVFIVDTLYRVDTIEKTPENLDRVWKDYFTTKLVTDTLNNDSILLAVAQYKISNNILQSRTFSFTSRVKSVIDNHYTVINPLKNKVFATLEVGGNKTITAENPSYSFGIYAGITLLTKSDNLYSLKYDPLNKGLYVGTAFKLFQYGKSQGN